MDQIVPNYETKIYQVVINEPTNVTKISHLVENELKKSLPSGWGFVFRIQNKFAHIPQTELSINHYEWKLIPHAESQIQDPSYLETGIPFYYYNLIISVETMSYIIFHSHRPVGNLCPGDFVFEIRPASHIDIRYSLSEFVKNIIQNNTCNHYGLS